MINFTLKFKIKFNIYHNYLSYYKVTTLKNLTEFFDNIVDTSSVPCFVEIQIERYRPVRVFVKGEVGSPGMKTLSGSIAVENKMELDLIDNIPRNGIDPKLYYKQTSRNYFFALNRQYYLPGQYFDLD